MTLRTFLFSERCYYNTTEREAWTEGYIWLHRNKSWRRGARITRERERERKRERERERERARERERWVRMTKWAANFATVGRGNNSFGSITAERRYVCAKLYTCRYSTAMARCDIHSLSLSLPISLPLSLSPSLSLSIFFLSISLSLALSLSSFLSRLAGVSGAESCWRVSSSVLSEWTRRMHSYMANDCESSPALLRLAIVPCSLPCFSHSLTFSLVCHTFTL